MRSEVRREARVLTHQLALLAASLYLQPLPLPGRPLPMASAHWLWKHHFLPSALQIQECLWPHQCPESPLLLVPLPHLCKLSQLPARWHAICFLPGPHSYIGCQVCGRQGLRIIQLNLHFLDKGILRPREGE